MKSRVNWAKVRRFLYLVFAAIRGERGLDGYDDNGNCVFIGAGIPAGENIIVTRVFFSPKRPTRTGQVVNRKMD